METQSKFLLKILKNKKINEINEILIKETDGPTTIDAGIKENKIMYFC